MGQCGVPQTINGFINNSSDIQESDLVPTHIRKFIEANEVGRIHIEQVWRRPAILSDATAPICKGVVSKWTDTRSHTRVVTVSPLSSHYTIGLALRKTAGTFSVSGSTVHDGDLSSGMFHICGPEDSVGTTFRTPCDFMHLFIKESFILQCFKESGIKLSCPKPAFSPYFRRDIIIEQLMRSLILPEAAVPSMGQLYIEGVCLAVIARLICAHYHLNDVAEKTKICALPNWRLKRAVEYIDSNIAEQITLGDVAKSTGLTRMYFAAQFRAATGLRPHEYILRRRIERAQDMLLATNVPLVDAALNVGFQTQAHFTTVFKKLVGQTPYRWREANLQYARSTKLLREGGNNNSTDFADSRFRPFPSDLLVRGKEGGIPSY